MLSLTERATTAIEQILGEADAGPEAGLRISHPETGGALKLALAPEPAAGDEVVCEGGAKVFLDETATAALDGKTLDIETHEDHFHFTLGDG